MCIQNNDSQLAIRAGCRVLRNGVRCDGIPKESMPVMDLFSCFEAEMDYSRRLVRNGHGQSPSS